MSSQSGRVGSLFITLAAGLGVALAACTSSEPVIRPVSGDPGVGTGPDGVTGAAGASIGGTGGDGMMPVAVDTPIGVSEPNGGVTTCVNGMAVSSMRPPGEGIPPQLPATTTHAATPVPPLSGGTLLALADGSTIAASDPERDQISFVDLVSNSLRAKVALQPGDEPGRLVEDAAGRLHVALRRGGAVATIDRVTAKVTSRQAVCSAPRGLVYEKATDLLHVACAGGELVSLPAAGGAATRTLTLDRDLRDVVLGTGGALLVSTFRKAELLVVAANGAVSARLTPGSGTVQGIFGPQNRTPSVAWRTVSFDETQGTVVMLHQTGQTDAIDPAMGGYAGLKGCGGIVQPGVTVLDQRNTTAPAVAGGLGMATLAIDVAVSPDRGKIALAIAGNSGNQGPMIEEVPMNRIDPQEAGPCTMVGAPPPSVTQPPGQVVAVVYARSGVLLAQTREPSAIFRTDTSVTIPLANDSRADTGHTIFHANAGGSLACASCHPEGGEDGRVWNFVCAGARRTQSIRGGISGTAPFHWDGAEPNFSRLMDDVFTGRMAGPMLADDQKSALQSWVDTIPALPKTAGLDAAAVARGQALFNDAKIACSSCHAGTLLTNNTTVDVGTGQALQVPSLRGVSWRAPFMHNGCAPSLASRFAAGGCGGGDKHGLTSTLTAAQIGDLTTYLQSL